ncbi:HET domain-containing protein [Fusarium sp. LHS14.1]|nr:HET domain-containing protein [Fusarium sp. LHS14.1]
MPAISALAEQMSLVLNDQYVAGLWRKDIIRGLLWQTLKDDPNFPARRIKGPYVAPSWSWASIHPGLVFALFSKTLHHGILSGNSDVIITDSRILPYDQVEELPVGAGSDIEILSIQCPTAGKNPFGQIRCGIIRLNGYTRDAAWKASSDGLYDCILHTRIGTLDFDEKPVPYYGKIDIRCLYIARYIPSSGEACFVGSSEDTQRFGKCICLALMPAGLRDNEYRRVGIAQIDYWKWEQEEKKELLLV